MHKKESRLLIGAHMSVSGGLHNAFTDGAQIGCTTLQIFTKSNRQWHAAPLTDDQVAEFKAAQKTSGISPVVAHATYLINIASPEEATSAKSTHALAQELTRCEQLGIQYLVLHPGSRLHGDEAQCLERIAHNLDKALAAAPGSTMVLLEIMAGQGSATAHTFEQLATILHKVHNKSRVGICFDTCHAFAAGYDFRDKESYEALWKNFDAVIGLEHLKVFHLNDSKKELGSRVDRHEDIGKGELGLEPFKLIMQDKRFADIPKILETPKETLEDDIRNLEVLRLLAE